MHTITADELVLFLHRIEDSLAVRGKIEGTGVSRVLSVEFQHHQLNVGTNGSDVWLDADLDWPHFPADTTIIFALTKSYMRGKLLENKPVRAYTGDKEFDDVYWLGGESAPKIATKLPTEVRRALLEHQGLQPEISGSEIVVSPTIQVRRRVYVKCRPDLRDNATASIFVEIGTQRFTPEYCSTRVSKLSELVKQLEAVSFKGV